MSDQLMPLSNRLTRTYGSDGTKWVRGLESTIRELCERWKLAQGEAFAPSSYSHVVSVRQADGSDAILKLRYPGREARCEVSALEAFAGQGAVPLLRSDVTICALLLPRISPGISAEGKGDQQVVSILQEVIHRLHTGPPSGASFPTTAKWGQGFQRYRASSSGVPKLISDDLLDKAEEVYFGLEETSAEHVLLHGDLHHANLILGRNHGWLAIDPQGVIGEPAYELGAFMRNPIGDLEKKPELDARMRSRTASLAEEFGFPVERIAGWAFAQSVLSAIWAVEGGEPDTSQWLRIARAIEGALQGSWL